MSKALNPREVAQDQQEQLVEIATKTGVTETIDEISVLATLIVDDEAEYHRCVHAPTGKQTYIYQDIHDQPHMC